MQMTTGLLKASLRNLFIIVHFSSYCTAGTYYVDHNHTSANDINPGTLNSPWLTLQHAAETLAAGDTVYIRNGIYHEHVYPERSGNAYSPIVYSNYPGENPVIDGTGVSQSQNGILIDKSYITMIGLDVRNWNDNGIWIENAAYIAISDCEVHDVFYGIGIADGTHDFIFNRVEVHHFDLYGFDVSPSGGADCYNGTFNDCVSHSARDSQQNVDGFALGHGTQHDFEFNRCSTHDVYDGFDISARSATLNRCLAYNCWNGGYKLWQDSVTLVNCIGYDCAVSIVELDWDGDPGVTTLLNCTFYHSETFTIWIENTADELHMRNCILAGGENICLAFEQRNIDNYRGDFNIFHNRNDNRVISVGYEDEFSSSQIDAGEWTSYSGQDANSHTVLIEEEMFLDHLNHNFHLHETSVAIDRGTSTGAPPDDFDGNPRPQGEGVDIGAYEYQGTVDVFSKEVIDNASKSFMLYQNFPNPFNTGTEICYSLSEPDYIMIDIYNTLGQKIRSLESRYHEAGKHMIRWNGTDDLGNLVSSGQYIVTVKSATGRQTRKMLLIQ